MLLIWWWLGHGNIRIKLFSIYEYYGIHKWVLNRWHLFFQTLIYFDHTVFFTLLVCKEILSDKQWNCFYIVPVFPVQLCLYNIANSVVINNRHLETNNVTPGDNRYRGFITIIQHPGRCQLANEMFKSKRCVWLLRFVGQLRRVLVFAWANT